MHLNSKYISSAASGCAPETKLTFASKLVVFCINYRYSESNLISDYSEPEPDITMYLICIYLKAFAYISNIDSYTLLKNALQHAFYFFKILHIFIRFTYRNIIVCCVHSCLEISHDGQLILKLSLVSLCD